MRRILFFLSHQPNPRFIKQINYLSNNSKISVLFFQRESIRDLSNEYVHNCVLNKKIFTIKDGNYLNRVFRYIKSIKQALNEIFISDSSFVIVNNIDTLFFIILYKSIYRKDCNVTMQISDLREHTYRKNLKSRLLRRIEKSLFFHVDKLVVTSPKFYDLYYKNLFFNEVFVLENKPLGVFMPKFNKHNGNSKIKIGIVGQLQQINPYITLLEQVKNSDQYEVHIHGMGPYTDVMKKYSFEYPNIFYHGSFNFFKDSAEIYSSLSMLYMPYDTTSDSLNNRVALPNKLYEAMFFQVPIITSSDTYLGSIVNDFGIGETLQCCKESEIIKTIELVCSKKSSYKDIFKKIDKNFYLGDSDYIEYEKYISKII